MSRSSRITRPKLPDVVADEVVENQPQCPQCTSTTRMQGMYPLRGRAVLSQWCVKCEYWFGRFKAVVTPKEGAENVLPLSPR